MCTLYTYTNICMSRFCPSGFFGPSRCLIPTPGLTSEHLFSVYNRKETSREGKLKTTNSVKTKRTNCRKQEKKRKEDLGTRVSERLVRRACSMHEGSMLMKSRSGQALGQGVVNIEEPQHLYNLISLARTHSRRKWTLTLTWLLRRDWRDSHS